MSCMVVLHSVRQAVLRGCLAGMNTKNTMYISNKLMSAIQHKLERGERIGSDAKRKLRSASVLANRQLLMPYLRPDKVRYFGRIIELERTANV